MLSSEIYGVYFRTVEAILRRALAGELDDRTLRDTVREKAFGESVLSIPAALRDGSWPLLRADLTTPLRRAPEMPLTTLEKRWLKALLLDKRVRLFDPPLTALEDVEPLYTPEVFVYYDRYADGDPFDDPKYIEIFRTILTALRERRRLRVRFHSGRDRRLSCDCVPCSLEYSSKDDKFRLTTSGWGKTVTVNLARIRSVELLEPWSPEEYRPPVFRVREAELLLTDERNALERVLLHFSDLEKETERLDEKHYRVRLRYRREDETELLIRILAFGPVLRVLGPESLTLQLRRRLERQRDL